MNKPNSHIQPLKKHLTALQNMQLAEALAVGEKFKEQGEEMKKERWKSGKNIDYRYIWTQFTLLQSSWMEDHSKELEKIGYAEWSNQVKDKFFEQFLEDCIIYDRHRLDELRTRVPNRVK